MCRTKRDREAAKPRRWRGVEPQAGGVRDRLPDPHKPAPQVEFEIRLPAGTRLPDDFHALHTAQRRDDQDDEGLQREDGDV